MTMIAALAAMIIDVHLFDEPGDAGRCDSQEPRSTAMTMDADAMRMAGDDDEGRWGRQEALADEAR